MAAHAGAEEGADRGTNDDAPGALESLDFNIAFIDSKKGTVEVLRLQTPADGIVADIVRALAAAEGVRFSSTKLFPLPAWPLSGGKPTVEAITTATAVSYDCFTIPTPVATLSRTCYFAARLGFPLPTAAAAAGGGGGDADDEGADYRYDDADDGADEGALDFFIVYVDPKGTVRELRVRAPADGEVADIVETLAATPGAGNGMNPSRVQLFRLPWPLSGGGNPTVEAITTATNAESERIYISTPVATLSRTHYFAARLGFPPLAPPVAGGGGGGGGGTGTKTAYCTVLAGCTGCVVDFRPPRPTWPVCRCGGGTHL